MPDLWGAKKRHPHPRCMCACMCGCVQVDAGQVLTLGAVDSKVGLRGYLAVGGGFDVPLYLGSRSTFPSGKFGGYQVGVAHAVRVGATCWLVVPASPLQPACAKKLAGLALPRTRAICNPNLTHPLASAHGRTCGQAGRGLLRVYEACVLYSAPGHWRLLNCPSPSPCLSLPSQPTSLCTVLPPCFCSHPRPFSA